MSDYIVAAIGEWNKTVFEQKKNEFKGNWYFASTPDELNSLLEKIFPKYIFFLHWRWIVPKDVTLKYECVCFHMTDLPYGRGGSPLQNLIVRGHKESVLTALKMDEGVDTGPIYSKKKLDISGSASEIYQRCSELSWEMALDIIDSELLPKRQEGEAVIFKRRKPDESEIPKELSLEQVYDYIRMLDAPGYPHAFIEYGGLCIEFKNAELNGNELTASVKFTVKN